MKLKLQFILLKKYLEKMKLELIITHISVLLMLIILTETKEKIKQLAISKSLYIIIPKSLQKYVQGKIVCMIDKLCRPKYYISPELSDLIPIHNFY